nr:HAD family hydrolase [Ancylobacter oerskovii]
MFDKDGTLIDFDRTWGPAAGGVMARLAGGDAAVLSRLHEVSHYLADHERFLQTSPLIAGSSRQYGPLWAQVLDRPADEALFVEIDELFIEEGQAHLAPLGHPREALARLARLGLPLGIATNDSERNARIQADILGLTELLAAIYGHDSGFGSKPLPGMVRAFAERAGVPVSAVALVGDTHHDLLTAKAAGAVSVLVRSGPGPIDAFAGEADLVVDDVEALAELFLEPA